MSKTIVVFCPNPNCVMYGFRLSENDTSCPVCNSGAKRESLPRCSCGKILYPAYDKCKGCGTPCKKDATE